MRKLALSDEILLKVENPARYIGNEVDSVMKDKNVDMRLPCASRILTSRDVPTQNPDTIRHVQSA